MKENGRKKMAAEWNEILKSHPRFARVFLAQQAILMEASELGYRSIDRGMCRLLETGLPVLFQDFWASRCQEVTVAHIEIGGLIGCLSETNRDPADCFGSDDPEGWFDDPFAGEQTLPPRPPDPHIR